MNTQHYYVEKASDTSADTLLAIGFALLLRQVLLAVRKRSKGIVIRDSGPHFTIQLPVPITESDLEKLIPFSLIAPLVTEKLAGKQAKQGALLDGFDYQGQQERRNIFSERVKKLPPEFRTPEARPKLSQHPELADIEEPDSRLVHYQAIQQMRIASSFNELAQRWIALGTTQRAVLRVLLTGFCQPQNDIPTLIASWQDLTKQPDAKGKALVTRLQIVNPVTGKGANRAKASVLLEGNPEQFWVLELLKFVGFLAASAPYVIQGSKDRKCYVVQPRVIELSTLQAMMERFRAVCWSSTVVKMDILASLRFAQVFLQLREQALEGEQEEEDELSEEEPLYSLVQGFEVASYKDMGSAFATINVASLGLPQWLPRILSSQGEVRSAMALLQEHLTIIYQIRNGKGEEGSEEYELLRFYRNFLSGRDLKPFWQFTTAYSSYLISQREREKDPRRQLRAFTRNGLEQLLTMSQVKEHKQLMTIIQNAGFRRIAYAIRQSTIKAQYRRSQLRNRTYEVRYGLGQELMREARYKEKFIAVLSQFLHQYNAETAREEEKLANRLQRPLDLKDRRTHMLRGRVAYTDIEDIVALIDEFGSEQVCSLLVAFGYASDPRREGKTETAAIDDASSADDLTPPLLDSTEMEDDGE